MKKILYIAPLPPPHYGCAIACQKNLEILKNCKDLSVKNIKINYSTKMSDIGKLSYSKIRGFLKVKREIREKILGYRPDLIYFVPATAGAGLIRDYLFFRQIKRYYKKPILLHLHSKIQERDFNNIFKRRLFYRILWGQKVIILGKELIRDLQGLVMKKNIYILPNAIQNKISQKDLQRILKERKKK
jgi:hypothetical protein